MFILGWSSVSGEALSSQPKGNAELGIRGCWNHTSCLGLLCHNDFIPVRISLSAAVFLWSWWQRAGTWLIPGRGEEHQEEEPPCRENISVRNAFFLRFFFFFFKFQRHCPWLRGKIRDVEWGLRPQAYEYFPFLSTFCIFPFLNAVLTGAPWPQRCVGAPSSPHSWGHPALLTPIPRWCGPTERPGWPHPLVDGPKWVPVRCTQICPHGCAPSWARCCPETLGSLHSGCESLKATKGTVQAYPGLLWADEGHMGF